MALIDRTFYDDLENSIEKAKESGEGLTVRLDAIKKDLKKRKTGWLARVIILAAWAVIFLGAILIAAGILELGGGASGAVGDVSSAPPPEVEPLITFSMLPTLLIAATWTLCFVGFPIGWNWSKDERRDAKNQVYVQHTVREDGTVDTYQSTLVPKLSAGIFSALQGVLTMVFSVPIAIVQCFTWKKDIKRIEALIAEIENNPSLIAA